MNILLLLLGMSASFDPRVSFSISIGPYLCYDTERDQAHQSFVPHGNPVPGPAGSHPFDVSRADLTPVTLTM